VVLNIIVPLIAGIAIGYFLRKRKHLDLGKVTLGAIVLLIFSMGFSIGSNNELLQLMPNIGFDAVAMVGLALFFSVIFLKAFRKVVRLN
jgi:uncharacterized membrane protein YbjE (DUF340 family)